MSRNKTAIKRQGQALKYAHKKQKLSVEDEGDPKIIIYPKTSTTKAVLEKFENRNSHRKERIETEVSKNAKYSPVNIISPSLPVSRFINQSKEKTNKITTHTDRYSPKNIKSPTAIESNSFRLVRVWNKEKLSLQNKPFDRNPTPSCLNKSISENQKPSCSHTVSPENHGCSIQIDISEKQLTKTSAIVSADPSELLRKANEGRKCVKYEEEMNLFFQKLVPYTVALSEGKQNKFKAQVVTSLQRIIGGELLELSLDG